MKNISILFVLLLSACAGSGKLKFSDADLRILEAVKVERSMGANIEGQEGMRTEYMVRVEQMNNKSISFDSIWVNGRRFEAVQPLKKVMAKGDIYWVRSVTPAMQDPNTVLPMKGSSALSYWIDGKKRKAVEINMGYRTEEQIMQ